MLVFDLPAPLEDVGAMVEWVVDHARRIRLGSFESVALWEVQERI